MSAITVTTSRSVLTVSACYNPPKGGIAQVITVYADMYPVFNHLATKKGNGSLSKLLTLAIAIPMFIFVCLFKDIRIVHVHGASYNSFRRKRIFIYLAKLLNIKVIYHIHGGKFKDFYRDNISSVKSVFERADAVVALSESWKRFFEQEIGHSKVRVIENVVLLPSIKLVQKDLLVRFLFLGALRERKGIYDLLDVIAANATVLSGRAMFHIGGNEEVKQVQDRIKHLSIDDLVIFEGWVAGDKKVKLLNLVDVYILPSYNEGLPISILEAMSYRLPVISTPVGGIPEVVVSGENGILVQPGDNGALADAILTMVADEEFRSRAGKLSFQKVQPYFSESVAKKLESLYRELLD